MTIKIDTTLADRYQIIQRLSPKTGRQTFLAQDLQTQNFVVIKILPFDTNFQWDDLKLFEREALTLKNLNHPAIPQYLDYFDVETADTRGFALVQTYINAPSLESIIKSGRKFSEAEIIELAYRLLTILSYLHEQIPPVIHRDIKPSNILLTNRSGHSIGDVYIVDFGSVQTAASKEDGTITIVGTYGYIPLEQFGGQTTIASDLYSLGMTLIYLITGTHPAALPCVDGRVKFTAEISNRLHRWLERMTQPYLDKRFDSDRSAQMALVSNDGSYGDFNAIRPPNCTTKLYRDRDRLEIILHNDVLKLDSTTTYGEKVETNLGKLATFGCLLWMLVLIVALIKYSLALPIFFGHFIAASIGIYLIASANNTDNPRDGSHTKIIIKNDYICAIQITSVSKKQSKTLMKNLRSQFDLVSYNPGYTFDNYLDGNQQIIKRGEVITQPELHIYCTSATYSLSNSISQAELYWLGKEISDFMNLELQVIYPTPRAPLKPESYGI
jgi:serine/threonine protein kinase